MGFLSFILSALVAFGGTATGFCGTPQPTEEQMRTARNLQVREAVSRSSMGSTLANTTDINIKVYYHVVADYGSNGDGYLAQLERQTQVLNARYAPHNIAWTHGGAEWVVAPNWSNNQNEQAMSEKLRKGTYADLNVYLTSTIDFVQGEYIGPWGTILGFCWNFPRMWLPNKAALHTDGITIRYDTRAGSGTSYGNLGMNLVHEAGHWLGLYHTFQGGCWGEGDGIDDTPAEAPHSPYGCDLNRNSCPGGGHDPVTNYMDYSDQACLTEFTPGQEDRMRSQWADFRAPHQVS